jgi:hypothetical protein
MLFLVKLNSERNYMKVFKYTFLALIIVSTLKIHSQAKDVLEPINIKTVILKPLAANRYAPQMRMGETFILAFDDLEANQKEYYYKIEHCDFNWNSSNLSDREFINGYSEDRIRNYESSFNTLQFYTHYSITFPNSQTSFKISGNYKILVLDDNNNVIFTRKFVLYDSKVSVGMTINRSRDLAYFDTKQYVDFVINHPNFLINNPSVEIKTVLMQNNDWNTAIKDLKAQYYRGSQLIYKYVNETNFWAGNEFRYFDSKGVRDANNEIARVDVGPNLYHTILYTDEERIDLPYSLNPDINGNFVVRTIDGNDNSDIDADYTWVFFYLESFENLNDKKVYINGSFSNWKIHDDFEMKYNSESNLYEAILLMKQGFYNYQYVTVGADNTISNSDIDGSFHLTENDYTLLVYYRPFGSRYDQVIGIGHGKSDKFLN